MEKNKVKRKVNGEFAVSNIITFVIIGVCLFNKTFVFVFLYKHIYDIMLAYCISSIILSFVVYGLHLKYFEIPMFVFIFVIVCSIVVVSVKSKGLFMDFVLLLIWSFVSLLNAFRNTVFEIIYEGKTQSKKNLLQ